MKSRLELTIPLELADGIEGLTLPTAEGRMSEVIEWSLQNVKRGGGPFAAGVFRLSDGACISIGVNRVVDCNCSVAHAEMMALMFAQQVLGTHDLSAEGDFVLTSSSQPCSQCFGALPWAGIKCLEFGAGRKMVEEIGFDEGPVPENWADSLTERGIQVRGPLLEPQATQVLREYILLGGPLY